MIPSCWKITKILNSSIIYCAHNFLENVCIYFCTVVVRRPNVFGKVLSPCFPLSLIAVELDRKRRFNKPMDLEALAYIHACLSATLKKMTRRSCGDFFKNDKFYWLFYLILSVKWVVISTVTFRWSAYNDPSIIKYMINDKLLV